ncbi:MAG: serine hydrolase [Selenomonadaceae bacterium]|nr:serine hydrolase [Selenomonadaceae bacterium]
MTVLDNELESLIGGDEIKVPGLGVIVYKDGMEIYSKFLGRRIIESSKPVTRQTRFRAASVAKMFTVFSVLQLAEQGKINLDADISEYLNFTLRNPNQPREKITARMLASHTSSLCDEKIYSIPPEVSVKEFFTPDGRFWEGGAHFAKENVGEYFTYCNLNYGLLGTIIEVVTGERFDIWQKKNILKQLDTRADYVPSNFERAEFEMLGATYRKENPSGAWYGEIDDFKGIQPARDTISLQNAYDKNFQHVCDLKAYKVGTNATIFSPQGGLRISFEELAHALEMLMNGGTFRGKKILSKKSVEEMLTPHWIYNGKNGDTQDGAIKSYGLGIYNYNKNLSGHTGEAFGLLSGLYFIPNSKSGFVFMTNGEAFKDANYILEEKIIDALCNFLSRHK